MPDASRLAFAARHFRDLQTIRFAPVPVAMTLAPAARHLPHPSRGEAWALVLIFLLASGGFYGWSTTAIRRRYGTIAEVKGEALRMRFHPVIILLSVALVLYAIAPHKPWPWSDVYLIYTVSLLMLVPILDRTNLASRRIAWAAGLVILFGVGRFVVNIDEGAILISLAGAVWLALSTFDFLLLRRSLSRAPPPQSSMPDAVAHNG